MLGVGYGERFSQSKQAILRFGGQTYLVSVHKRLSVLPDSSESVDISVDNVRNRRQTSKPDVFVGVRVACFEE